MDLGQWLSSVVIAAVISGAFAYATHRTNAKASRKVAEVNAVTERQTARDEAESEAFERAARIYQGSIAQLERERDDDREEIQELRRNVDQLRRELDTCKGELANAKRTIRRLAGDRPVD